MTSQLDQLYKNLSNIKLFEKMSECEDCKFKCDSPTRERWLLREEVKRLSNLFPKIVDINGTPFFEGGPCVNLKDGKCGIYDIRPLECRLSPVKLIEKDEELYWMLAKHCKILVGDVVEQINIVKERAWVYIDKVEKFMPAEYWEEILAACKAIKTFDPYEDGKDCFVLRKVKIRKA